jgi:hypothetical protein
MYAFSAFILPVAKAFKNEKTVLFHYHSIMFELHVSKACDKSYMSTALSALLASPNATLGPILFSTSLCGSSAFILSVAKASK